MQNQVSEIAKKALIDPSQIEKMMVSCINSLSSGELSEVVSNVEPLDTILEKHIDHPYLIILVFENLTHQLKVKGRINPYSETDTLDEYPRRGKHKST